MENGFYAGSARPCSGAMKVDTAQTDKALLKVLLSDFNTCSAMLASVEDRLEGFSARLGGAAPPNSGEVAGGQAMPAGVVSELSQVQQGLRHRVERLLKLMTRLEGIA